MTNLTILDAKGVTKAVDAEIEATFETGGEDVIYIELEMDDAEEAYMTLVWETFSDDWSSDSDKYGSYRRSQHEDHE